MIPSWPQLTTGWVQWAVQGRATRVLLAYRSDDVVNNELLLIATADGCGLTAASAEKFAPKLGVENVPLF
jgi:hypothetical protein